MQIIPIEISSHTFGLIHHIRLKNPQKSQNKISKQCIMMLNAITITKNQYTQYQQQQ